MFYFESRPDIVFYVVLPTWPWCLGLPHVVSIWMEGPKVLADVYLYIVTEKVYTSAMKNIQKNTDNKPNDWNEQIQIEACVKSFIGLYF